MFMLDDQLRIYYKIYGNSWNYSIYSRTFSYNVFFYVIYTYGK